ncbi:hypothetical protein ACFYZU_33880 [Streptomyces sp. NPDC001651]|uniref:hypothetical protein n=1 Tax=Streptomyces sp. NPDC001651 TaxID=3364596 RepID=UPI00368A6067
MITKAAWHVFAPTDQEVLRRDMKASGVAAMRYVVNDGLKTQAERSRPKSASTMTNRPGAPEGVSGSRIVHSVRDTGHQQNTTLSESPGEERSQARTQHTAQARQSQKGELAGRTRVGK